MNPNIGKRQRGAILAAALICLLIMMLFAGAVARSILLRQNATRGDERQMQGFWLAESAALRAIARSREDPAYQGEIWRVTAMVRGEPVQGVAEIQVEPVAGSENSKQVKITARWPDKPMERVVRTKEFVLRSGSSDESPKN